MFKTKGIAFALVIAVILVLSGCNAEPVTTTITKTDTITTTKTVSVTETITQTSNITSTVTTTLIPATTTTSKTSTTTDTTVATTDTTTATTTQSQEIFSEDGKVKTLKHWMEAHITSISVFAVVKNVSDAPVNVLYKVDFLDAYGNLIGTLEKYAEDLQPGKSKQLELVYEGNYSQNVMCYFIYLSAE
jgi:uncharacterized protein YcfL